MHHSTFTVFEYMYRDAGNYKVHGALYLDGRLADFEIDELCSRLEGGEYFIAEQIGVPSLRPQLLFLSDGPTCDDHAWHEFIRIRAATERESEIDAPQMEARVLFDAIMAVETWDVRLADAPDVTCLPTYS